MAEPYETKPADSATALANDIQFQFATIHELIQAAHKTVSQGVWDYLAGGSDSESTLRRNRRGYDKIGFRPRAMVDVTKFDPSAEFLGKKVRMPVLLAPVGSIESFAPEGGAATAKAAERFNVFDVLSSRCFPGLEAVAEAANNPRIFQLYVRGDDDFVDDYVKRAIDNGYDGFAVTVDSAAYTRRERDLANRYLKKWRSNVSGDDHAWQAKWTWDNVKRFKDKWDIPFILKGIGDVEDAARACAEGVDVVYVSNHGGRALDHGRGTIEVLPEIVAECKGKAKIVVDGGIQRGTDIVKAKALGADMVAIGRLQCVGLGAAGVDGLVRVLELLEEEVSIAFALMGVNRFDELSPDNLVPVDPVHEPSVWSSHIMTKLPEHPYGG
jgi:isopentenyl diphosphate isomerase/L-lactate dehydrogenase-like FMN-dependent dehydrogenase